MWFNFHTHSSYCDGKSTLAQIIAEAKKLNFFSLGFSSHAPLPFNSPWCMKKEMLVDYLHQIGQYKNAVVDFEIQAGLEVDYIPNIIGPHDFKNKLDYTIGSIHFVDSFSNGIGWEIDGPHTFFLKGLHEIFHNNFKDACCRYYELTREMIVRSPPDVVGHLDKIKIQNINQRFFHETDGWYIHQIKQTLEALRKSGSIVEINTRGIYQKKTNTTYPSPWILELIREKNIPVTISSDAHLATDLITEFPATLSLLKEIGFHEIFVLYRNQWQPFSFDTDGIKAS